MRDRSGGSLDNGMRDGLSEAGLSKPVGQGLHRREFCSTLASFAVLPASTSCAFIPSAGSRAYPLYEEAVANVVPEGGFQSRIALKDAVLQLIDHTVIDRGKFFALARQRGVPPPELSTVLSEPSDRPILLTRRNAGEYVNLLWPIGLSNFMAGNVESPVNGNSLFDLASTGGWKLGGAENGGTYFNAFPIVRLSEEQEHLVIRVAKSTYRPCCNNSTFFQDCNHGSALLGLLQLGASQGLGEADLYREALAFNSFWFQDQYVRTALYFKVLKGAEWPDMDPAVVLGVRYSTLTYWQKNIERPLATIPDLIPPPEDGANCGA